MPNKQLSSRSPQQSHGLDKGSLAKGWMPCFRLCIFYLLMVRKGDVLLVTLYSQTHFHRQVWFTFLLTRIGCYGLLGKDLKQAPGHRLSRVMLSWNGSKYQPSDDLGRCYKTWSLMLKSSSLKEIEAELLCLLEVRIGKEMTSRVSVLMVFQLYRSIWSMATYSVETQTTLGHHRHPFKCKTTPDR